MKTVPTGAQPVAPIEAYAVPGLGHLLSRAAAMGDGGIVEGDHLTPWADLDAAAGRLGALLAERGIRAGDRVGVHFRKSTDGFVAMHAAVRIGAVAVPLDPGAPSSYLAAVATETGISAICTHAPCRSSARAVTELAELDASLVIEPEHYDDLAPIPPTPTELTQPAYIITTSGSTGRPKGVVHTHGSALANIDRAHRSLGLTATDRIGDVAPHHFDVSTLALWNTPYAGATAIVVSEGHQMMPASLSALVESSAMTLWYSAPFTLRQMEMRGVLDQRDLSALRWVLFGGEVYPPLALASLMHHLPNAVLRNVYGPCETNWCAHLDITTPPTGDEPVAIGRPPEGLNLRLVPPTPTGSQPGGSAIPSGEVAPGDQGEIWVQGPTTMAGYWQRPDLDDQSFVVELDGPFEGLWYRTGDLAHIRADGEMVFDGRVDHQKKVRGHRVELEFIETILEDVPEIDLVVAEIARSPSDGVDEVVAGVLRNDGAEPDLATVEGHAAAHLPAYAQPGRYLVLDAGHQPKTGSGKLDRRRLRAELLQKLSSAADVPLKP